MKLNRIVPELSGWCTKQKVLQPITEAPKFSYTSQNKSVVNK